VCMLLAASTAHRPCARDALLRQPRTHQTAATGPRPPGPRRDGSTGRSHPPSPPACAVHTHTHAPCAPSLSCACSSWCMARVAGRVCRAWPARNSTAPGSTHPSTPLPAQSKHAPPHPSLLKANTHARTPLPAQNTHIAHARRAG
jgi:hypothetical protein